MTASAGPIAVGLWPETFGRDPASWIETGLALFRNPPGGGAALEPERAIAVIQAWDETGDRGRARADRVKASGWVLALDPVDQTWRPRAVTVSATRTAP